MTEVVTYLRVNINGNWTNLGIVAGEDEIHEHFEFVENLLKEKQRADELENILNHIKSHLDDLWRNGDSFEHEYAINTLKYINSLEDNNARSE